MYLQSCTAKTRLQGHRELSPIISHAPQKLGYKDRGNCLQQSDTKKVEDSILPISETLGSLWTPTYLVESRFLDLLCDAEMAFDNLNDDYHLAATEVVGICASKDTHSKEPIIYYLISQNHADF
ncbi:hypothetical protein AgCh_027444 [Apium graveolens]